MPSLACGLSTARGQVLSGGVCGRSRTARGETRPGANARGGGSPTAVVAAAAARRVAAVPVAAGAEVDGALLELVGVGIARGRVVEHARHQAARCGRAGVVATVAAVEHLLG